MVVARDFSARLPVVAMTLGFSHADGAEVKLMQRADMGAYEIEESKMLHVACPRARREPPATALALPPAAPADLLRPRGPYPARRA